MTGEENKAIIAYSTLLIRCLAVSGDASGNARASASTIDLPSLLFTKTEAGLDPLLDFFPRALSYRSSSSVAALGSSRLSRLLREKGRRDRGMKQEKEKKGRGSKLGRWLGAPVRALSRACDSYVRRMSACAGMMPTHAGAVGGRGGYHAPAMQAAASFSSRSRRTGADDDVEALVRAASRRRAAAAAGGGGGEVSSVPARTRSCAAVVVGRIDEDAPCEFGAGDDVRVGGPAAPVRRARSVAVGGGAAGLAKRANAGAAKRSAVHG
ncbi:hypothetical protein PR202_ga05634 [Eleusine coracana subsp. coracana]|uniref:Uncharacterized protein n=1 Tax=Eleusine coracana subsp. coracana TaxID=191504 RepID=A0AAV5BRU4_ELECO|nr:hypothetical protein PR202_ga05180 [Eleusine coracana subsp. coracana]GJM89439.1 hypothetical protein PR202_ga05634 [Eleusine coracana subsp. coracana]